MNKNTWFVINDDGELAGHDLSNERADELAFIMNEDENREDYETLDASYKEDELENKYKLEEGHDMTKTFAFETKTGFRIDIKATTIEKAIEHAKLIKNKLTGYYFLYDKSGLHQIYEGWDGKVIL